MTKPKYNFPIYTKADGILIKPSTVAADTVGDRVTRAEDLTEGRWYAVFTNATSPHTLLRAQYTGTDTIGNHVFKVCPEDYANIPTVSCELTSTNENLRTGKGTGGGTFGVYKFKQANQLSAKPMTKQQSSPYGKGSICKEHGIKEGDKFVVVVSPNSSIPVGTVVTLTYDDNSSCPYFSVLGFKARCALYLWRLAPVLQNVPKPNRVKPEVSPYEDSVNATCARYGLKVGDKFKVINAVGHNLIAIGDVLTLWEDDGTTCPYFICEATGAKAWVCLSRLVPLVTNPTQPITTLSTGDQFKSEIDALRAQVAQKRGQIAKLSEEIAEINVTVNDVKGKLKDSLAGYI